MLSTALGAGALVAILGFIAGIIRLLFVRIDNLEKRLDKAENAIRAEAAHRNLVERLLERVSGFYQVMRTDYLKLGRTAHNAGVITVEQFEDIKATPEIKELLNSPVEVSGVVKPIIVTGQPAPVAPNDDANS